MTAAAPAGRRDLRLLAALLRFVLASTELWLGCLWLAGRAEPLTLLAAHAAVAGTILAAAWGLRRTDTGLWLDAALILCTGPLGAVSMLWQRGPRNPAEQAAILRESASPGEKSPAQLLHGDLLAGRRRRGDPENRLSMMDRVTRGDLANQQFAISMLSLKYQPEMHPVLLAALQSPTPALRVQAAAVFAKLRERFGAEAKQLLATDASGDPRALREHAASCRRLAQSPFTDGAVATSLIERARSLEDGPAGAAPDSEASSPPESRPEAPERAGHVLVTGRSVRYGLRVKAAG